MAAPKTVFIFSGKRKCGKDFLTDKLVDRLGKDKAVILRLAGPIKEQYAKDHNLDFEELLTTSAYKEEHRLNMIKWSEEIRNRIPDFFINKAIEMYEAPKYPVWIISDARRRSDLLHLLSAYPGRCVTVRMTASEAVRKERGWTFIKGVDDAESECDLDSYTEWDHVVDTSDSDPQTVEEMLQILQKNFEDSSLKS